MHSEMCSFSSFLWPIEKHVHSHGESRPAPFLSRFGLGATRGTTKGGGAGTPSGGAAVTVGYPAIHPGALARAEVITPVPDHTFPQ